MTVNVDIISRHLELLFGGAPDGNVVLFELAKDKSISRHVVVPYNERSIIVDRLANQPDDLHMYVGMAMHDDNALAKQTRKNETASYITCIVLDVDIQTGVHAAKNYPASEAEALELLKETGLPAPSFITHSGGGLYPHWLLDEPFHIDSEQARVRASQLLEKWHQRVNAVWKLHDVKVDATFDLARVFRVPGSSNPKTSPPRLVHYFQEDNGGRWSIDELETFLPASPEGGADQAVPSSGLASFLKAQMANGESEAARAAARGALSMLFGCDFVRHCDEEAAVLPEPAWKDAADLFAHIPEGKRYFHYMSKDHPDYSYAETEEKLRRAAEYGPKHCATIAGQHEGCKDCIFFKAELFKSPVALTRSEPKLAQIQSRYVLDAKTGLHFDVLSGLSKRERDFDRSYTRNMIDRKSAVATFMRSDTSVIVAGHDYLPGNPDVIVTEGKEQYLNLWRRGGIAAKEGDASLWLEHVAYMFPDATVQKYVLQYLAHLIQHPAVKIKSAILIQSSQGVGKNLLLEAVSQMFHSNDVRAYYGGIVGDRFQADLGNCMVAVLDELQVDELSTAYNRLKRWVTEELNSVERKGIDSYDVRTPRGMFILTNHLVPIKIDADDRRIGVFKVDAEKREQSYYQRLVQEGFAEDSIAAFKFFLENLCLAGFDANAEPPMTEAKQELARASQPITEQILMELRDAEAFPFDRPIYLSEEVALVVGERMKRVVPVQQITPILKRLGDEKTASKVSLGTHRGKPRVRRHVWSWRNQSYWTTATTEAFREEFSSISPLSLAAANLNNGGSHDARLSS